MAAFDFLNTIRNNLTGFFNQSARSGQGFLDNLFQTDPIVFTKPSPPTPAPNIQVRSSRPTPSPSPASIPAPSSRTFNRDPQELEKRILLGLASAGFGSAPANRLAPQFAQVGAQLPPKVDPFLPVILALMESGGGQYLSSPNNLFNIGPGFSYPSLEVALMGGGPQNQLGFQGLLRPEGLYQDFLNSGDLGQFFNKFTPSSDPLNPSQAQLVQRFNTLRGNF